MFSLETHERESVVWRKIYEHLQERLETMRLTLEKTDDHLQGQKIRGRIEEIRHLLDLNKVRVRPEFYQSSPTS